MVAKKKKEKEEGVEEQVKETKETVKEEKKEDVEKIEVTKEEFENLKKWMERAKVLEEQLLRLKADFENYRRRVQQEMENVRRYAAEAIICDLLPVLDNFERALKAARKTENMDSFIEGVLLIKEQLDDVLANYGVEPIEALGTMFDPAYHEAAECVESSEHPDGMVVEELRRGYKLHDKVIRPSMVKVSKKVEEEDIGGEKDG